MATTATKYCGICEQEHLNEPADVWCPECDEAYCTNCKKHHAFSKLSKNHTIIRIEDYFQLPSFLLSTKHICHNHCSQFELYCKAHNTPCCVFCMKDTHKECLQFEPLKEVVKDIKHSSRFSVLEQLLKKVMSDIDFLTEHTFKNISNVDSKTNECLEKIKQKRKELNDHFDKLEEKLKDEILSQKRTTAKNVESIMTELHSRKENIIVIKENIMKMKNLSTDLQTFFGLIETEKEVTAHENYLNSLNDSESLLQTELSLNTLVVDDLMLHFGSLGQLIVDIVFLPHKDVAVISFGGKKIIFVDLLSNKQIKTISVKGYGIDYINDIIVSTSGKETFSLLDLKDDVVSEVCLKTSAYYVTATGTCVYCSDLNNHAVISSDYKGKQLWKFTHDKLSEPLGITSTLNGYIFVADRRSQNVFLISPDGSESSIVLTLTGAGPRGIHFSQSRNELLVTQEFGDEISLYDVQF